MDLYGILLEVCTVKISKQSSLAFPSTGFWWVSLEGNSQGEFSFSLFFPSHNMAIQQIFKNIFNTF